MRGKTIKRLRKKLLKETGPMLMIIRNHYGEKTAGMNQRQVYQAAKRLFKQGKIKL